MFRFVLILYSNTGNKDKVLTFARESLQSGMKKVYDVLSTFEGRYHLEVDF